MSYIPGVHNMKARQGSTFTETLVVKIDGSALNLTGYTARMMVRTHPSSETIVLTLTTENGRIAITGATGTITLTISASDMDAITARSYRYDLEIVTGTTVIPLLEGAFIVSPQVTR
jgi:hypothetical protein